MKIEIYRDEQELMCKIPAQGDSPLSELSLALGMIPAELMVVIWGPNVPELEIKCSISDDESKQIENIKARLEEKYKSI